MQRDDDVSRSDYMQGRADLQPESELSGIGQLRRFDDVRAEPDLRSALLVLGPVDLCRRQCSDLPG
jgi:hypothetical protein